MSAADVGNDWRIDSKLAVMTRQFVFDSYEHTRSFINELANLSESTGFYPNLTFNRTQATVTIFTEGQPLGDSEYRFASATDRIAGQINQPAE